MLTYMLAYTDDHEGIWAYMLAYMLAYMDDYGCVWVYMLVYLLAYMSAYTGDYGSIMLACMFA